LKILFIAPIPPPITGHSLATKILLDEVSQFNEVVLVNLSKKNLLNHRSNALTRSFELLKILIKIYRNYKKADLIYLTISESFFGNFKDILIYIICYSKIHNLVVHLHGGSIEKELWSKSPFLYKTNKYFLQKIKLAVVCSKMHESIFKDILSQKKVITLNNFSTNELFLTEDAILQKFKSKKIKIVFISNLIPKKGYFDLLNAFLSLNKDYKKRITIDFAGEFDTKINKNNFLSKIMPYKQLHYHGVISGEAKKELFSKAHIFCLPTSYFEGQPVSLIESYASGCCALVTKMGGINDIFEDKVNGIEIFPNNSNSIVKAIEFSLENIDFLLETAINNNKKAKKMFTIQHFIDNSKKIINF
jgi:glycosyltransferase involved in cell wall biosynthesis